jgi:PII-like signaling protein
MRRSEPARLLQIHICESDQHTGNPLYEAIVAKSWEMGVAGATVFRGVEGFGESGEIHRAHLGRNDRPVQITVVDSVERIEELMKVVEPMMGTGLMVVSDVERIRLER